MVTTVRHAELTILITGMGSAQRPSAIGHARRWHRLAAPNLQSQTRQPLVHGPSPRIVAAHRDIIVTCIHRLDLEVVQVIVPKAKINVLRDSNQIDSASLGFRV